MKTVAVIGASSNRDKFGNKALRAFAKRGYTVIPINPREAEVEGHRTYPSVLDVPGPIDLATIYVPPRTGVRIVEELAKKGVNEVWLNPGADGLEVVSRARELGLRTRQLCSILAIGESPSNYCTVTTRFDTRGPRAYTHPQQLHESSSSKSPGALPVPHVAKHRQHQHNRTVSTENAVRPHATKQQAHSSAPVRRAGGGAR